MGDALCSMFLLNVANQAIPELLKLLELKGCLVSIDAQGCYVPIAEAIVARKADYLLAVKGNQPDLIDNTSQIFYKDQTYATAVSSL